MDNVILTESTRPLRIASIVDDMDSLTSAISLNTHIWGGAGNVILPAPNNDRDARLLQSAIRDTEPDIVLSDTDSVPNNLVSFLNDYPAPLQELSADLVHGVVSNRHPIRLAGGRLQHVASVLDKIDLPDDQEIYCPPLECRDPTLQLYFGDPARQYRQLLADRFELHVLPASTDRLQLEGLYLSPFVTTPWKLTLQETDRRSQWTLSGDERTSLSTPRSDHAKSLHLFIDDGSLPLRIAFWNTRRVNLASNKHLIPAEDILSSIYYLIEDIYNEDIDEIIIFRDTDRRSAAGLVGRIAQFLDETDKQCPVAVYHGGFEYSIGRGHPSGTIERVYTLGVGDDGAVRFNPEPPVGHTKKKSIFGVDLEVKKNDGSKLSLPSTNRVATLLMNSRSRIERARAQQDGGGALWLRRSPPVRPIQDGVAAVTKVGDECVFYLHGSATIVQLLLDEDNIELESSPETRYAKGTLKRLGGLNSSFSFIRDGGILILKILSYYRDKDGGRELPEIWHRMADDFSVSKSKAEDTVKEYMPKLLEAGLVRRGANLRCKTCGLEAWYSVNSLEEFVNCKGCQEDFQLTDKFLRYSFTLNQLAVRFLEEGGRAVLEGAAALKMIEPSATIQFGGYLRRSGETNPFAEVDIFLISRNALAVIECKDYYNLTQDRIADIVEAAEHLVNTAKELNFTEALLVVTTEDSTELLLEELVEWRGDPSTDQVELTTIINRDVYLDGMDGPYSARKVQFVDEHIGRSESENRVGGLKSEIGIGSYRGVYNSQWMRERIQSVRE